MRTIHPQFVMPEIEPFFALGYAHSGTTLLQLLVMAGQDIVSGPETHFFTHVLEPIENWRREGIPKEQLPGVLSRLEGRNSLPPGFREYAATNLASDPISPSVLLHALMTWDPDTRTQRHVRWLEKTPAHIEFLDEILAMFPNAKIVHILRDPRDAISSELANQSCGSARARRLFLFRHALRWRTQIPDALSRPEDRVLSVKYEDLAGSPKEVLRQTLSFLRLEYRENALVTFSHNFGTVVNADEKWKRLCSENRIINRSGVWKNRLSRREARIVELNCAKTMHACGYVEQESTRPRDATIRLQVLADRVSTRLFGSHPVIGNCPASPSS